MYVIIPILKINKMVILAFSTSSLEVSYTIQCTSIVQYTCVISPKLSGRERGCGDLYIVAFSTGGKSDKRSFSSFRIVISEEQHYVD